MSKLLRNAVRLGSSVRAAHTCTLIPGDGIGPEISESVQKIFQFETGKSSEPEGIHF